MLTLFLFQIVVKMKFITVSLAVLAVFSSVVLSEKVDFLASSSVVGTAKEDDVSPMVSCCSINCFEGVAFPLFNTNG